MNTLRRYFGFVFFFLAIFIFGFLTMIGGLMPGRTASTWCIRTFSKMVLWVSGLKLEIEGVENVDIEGPVIIMANHSTIMDIAIIPAAVPMDVRFIFKHTLAYIPIVGWGMVLSGMIPIQRGSKGPALKSLRKAAKQIARGTPIAIFPEGTRSRTGELGQLKKGGFLLAGLAKASLLPVRVTGAHTYCQRNYPLNNPGTIKVTIHPPIHYEPKQARSELIHRIQECLEP